MYTQIREYEIAVTLEPEVSWLDIAPIVEEIQDRGLEHGAVFVCVERTSMRVAAGGPGFDVVPLGVTFFFGALVAEVVRDVVYPFLKDRLLAIYRKVSQAERSMEFKPMGLVLVSNDLTVMYRLPAGLSDTEFAAALSSVSSHFASATGMRVKTMGEDMQLEDGGQAGVIVFDFDRSSGNWTMSEEAGAFLTWQQQRMVEADDGDPEEEQA